jgi:hypothetical protein
MPLSSASASNPEISAQFVKAINRYQFLGKTILGEVALCACKGSTDLFFVHRNRQTGLQGIIQEASYSTWLTL